ncbi:MAG: endonuclease V [Thermoplasmatota archaeon]
MEAVIKVDGPEGSRELEEACRNLPQREDLSAFFIEVIFPRLEMDRWLSELVSLVPMGSVTTFGALASALGTVRASRAVGELISIGSVNGPVHRVVYSDGSVPERSVEELSTEVPTVYKIEKDRMVGFELESPPLYSLISIQEVLSNRGDKEFERRISTVAGMDISSKDNVHAGAMIVMDREGKELNEVVHLGDVRFPYIPGLLFFREALILIPLLDKARSLGMVNSETLLVLDGNGILHPRRMGVAVQFGMVTDTMTCGIAKRLMIGQRGAPKKVDDLRSTASVTEGCEEIGTALIKEGTKPVYLSKGHGCSRKEITDVILGLWRSRIPEPTRRAHILANEARKTSPSGKF